jgi:hypothetical protein
MTEVRSEREAHAEGNVLQLHGVQGGVVGCAAGGPLEGSRFATTFQLISCCYGAPPSSGLAIVLQAAGVGGVGMGHEFAALTLSCDARSAAHLPSFAQR